MGLILRFKHGWNMVKVLLIGYLLPEPSCSKPVEAVKKIFIHEKIILRLTFNLVLALNSFRTIRDW